MLSCLLSRTARRALLPARRLHAGGGAPASEAPGVAHSSFRPESLPRHVAVVPDGNRRWAQARGLPTADGHEAGRRAVEQTVQLSLAWGVRALTVFAFSQENSGRPKMEVDYVMGMIERMIMEKVDEYQRDGIRMHVIGDPSGRPESLQKAAREAEEATRSNSKLHLMLATCYSGRWEIVEACRELARKARDGLIRPEDIDESALAGELRTSAAAGVELSCPDLVIRTSGEQRLSNFLLWQSAYSELYFTDALWPDFGEDEYVRALRAFHGRERRFGRRSV